MCAVFPAENANAEEEKDYYGFPNTISGTFNPNDGDNPYGQGKHPMGTKHESYISWQDNGDYDASVYNFEKPEDFYKSVKEAYEEAMEQEIEDNAPDQNVKAEENKDAKTEIKDDPEANKVKIVVKELVDTGAANDVSAKVEDDSKSVASNKQV
jgi:hypothetical protein